MNTLLFLLVVSGMVAAITGRRGTALLLFGAGLSLAAFWLAHHATGILPLEF